MKLLRTALIPFFLLTTNVFAQAPHQADSLVGAGFRYLDNYAQSQNLADARNAHRAFTKALEKQPKHAGAHLGLGLAYAAVERQQLDPLGVNDATRPVNNTMAVRHLVAALQNGAEAQRAAAAIVTIARREYFPERIRIAIEGLRGVSSPVEPVRTALAELQISLYDAAGAESSIGEAVSLSGQRVLGVAFLLQPAKVKRGGETYMATLVQADSAALVEFARDARWLADPEEASDWKTLGPHDLRERIASFWQRRALKAGVTVAERLATHFTRVQHAMDEFTYYRQRIGVAAGLAIDPGIDGREYDVDDRAFTYVRYGEPDERIMTIDGDYANNQTWVYRNLADRPISFDFFLLPMDARGWTLTSDVVRCTPSTLPYSLQYLRDRQSVDPRYGRLLAECQALRPDRGQVQNIALPMVTERKDYLQKAMLQDHGVPRTTRHIKLLADVLQFAGAPGSTEVTAVVTWPLSSMTILNEVARTAVSLTIADTIDGSVIVKDTTVSARVPAGANTAVARIYLTVPLLPGAGRFYRLSLRDMQAQDVVAIIGDSLDVREFTSRELVLSDLALVSGEGGSWSRNGRRLSLLPRGVRTARFGAYYEAYGVSAGAKYRTTITFEPQDEGLAALVRKLKGTRVVSLTFDGQNESSEPVVRELKNVESELPGGEYLLTVKIEVAGRTAMAQRRIAIP